MRTPPAREGFPFRRPRPGPPSPTPTAPPPYRGRDTPSRRRALRRSTRVARGQTVGNEYLPPGTPPPAKGSRAGGGPTARLVAPAAGGHGGGRPRPGLPHALGVRGGPHRVR